MVDKDLRGNFDRIELEEIIWTELKFYLKSINKEVLEINFYSLQLLLSETSSKQSTDSATFRSMKKNSSPHLIRVLWTINNPWKSIWDLFLGFWKKNKNIYVEGIPAAWPRQKHIKESTFELKRLRLKP